MKPYSMLAAAAMALASGNLLAYEIVGSHYHVEVEPNKFIDQLVLRCEDGHKITVAWQSNLADACGEDLMGNVTRPRPKANAPHAGEPQKPATPKQPQSHNDEAPEQDAQATLAPVEPTTHISPGMADILKQYEVCRRTHKDKSACAAERDRAMASLAEAKPADPAAPASSPVPVKSSDPAPAKDASAPAHSVEAAQPPRTDHATRSPAMSQPTPPVTAEQPAPAVTPQATQPIASEELIAGTPPAASSAPPAPAATPTVPASEAERRASAEKKISDDYTACMHKKPKLECDKARAKALADLEHPKGDLEHAKPAKPSHPQKRASVDARAHPLATQ